jgi:hypothetical protein
MVFLNIYKRLKITFWLKHYACDNYMYKKFNYIRIFMGLLMFKLDYDSSYNIYNIYNMTDNEFNLVKFIYEKISYALIVIFTHWSSDVVDHGLYFIMLM